MPCHPVQRNPDQSKQNLVAEYQLHPLQAYTELYLTRTAKEEVELELAEQRLQQERRKMEMEEQRYDEYNFAHMRPFI